MYIYIQHVYQSSLVQILGVLSQDGLLRFINIHTCKLVFDVGGLDTRITNVSFSPTGRHVVCVMDTGDMNVYSIQALTDQLNKVRDFLKLQSYLNAHFRFWNCTLNRS